MKAVIVEIREFDSAALTDDGCIIKVRNQNYAIGQVIELKKLTIRKPAKVIALAASAAAVVIMFGATAWAYFTPYTYVSFDEGATNAKTKAFSGDTLVNSACKIKATTCASGNLTQCVDLQATMVKTEPVSMLSLNSNGDKGCTLDGSTKKAPTDTVPEKCWP